LLIYHLRHKRTHEQQQNGEPIVDSFSEEDFDVDDQHIVDLEQESPESEHAYLAGSMSIPTTISEMQSMGPMSTGTNNMNGPQFNGTSMGPPQMVAAHNY
jgi:transcription factor STE12